jgi:hypothetical protein
MQVSKALVAVMVDGSRPTADVCDGYIAPT